MHNLEIPSKVKEITYLYSDRYEYYRLIMRFLYTQAIERVGDYVTQKEIMDYVTSYGFTDYDFKRVKEDLENLKSWNVINVIQDNSIPKTIAAFKEPNRLCQITAVGMLVEEFLIKRDEAANAPGGSLESTAFDNLAYLLQRLFAAVQRGNWEEATVHFSQGYLIFESIQTEASKFFQTVNEHSQKNIGTKEDLVHFKNILVLYLSTFLDQFGYNRNRIQRTLVMMAEHTTTREIAERMINYRLSVRRETISDPQALIENTLYKIERIYSWFGAGSTGKSSTDAGFLYGRVKEAIQSLLRGISLLADHTRYYTKRVDEYRKASEWFAGLDELEQSHRLAGYIFGAAETRFMLTSFCPDNVSEMPLWKVQDLPVEKIKPNNWSPKGPKKVYPIDDLSEEEDEQAQLLLEEQLMRVKMLENLFTDGILDLRKIYACSHIQLKIILEIVRNALGQQSAYDEYEKLTQHATTQLSTGKIVLIEIVSPTIVDVRTEQGTFSFPHFRISEVKQVG